VEGAELESGMADLGSVEVGRKGRGGFLPGTGACEPGLFEEPVLVTAFAPFAKVARVEIFAVGTEALDNVGVRDAIKHPGTDFIAERFGEPGDFAIAAIGEWGWRFLSPSDGGFGFGVHAS
jgi:hypothetical protein